ncbi:unnamed protein product [Dracunculus medinensis]|uniref:Uncharacterized protein n=1 Tax=Dracunculus medinensis TaxID=318479 RepID=A0A3P7PQV0_DRAME|nr:unnamed protein product [Dracunculus medinensis]
MHVFIFSDIFLPKATLNLNEYFSELKNFYEENKDKANLYVVYVVSGTMCSNSKKYSPSFYRRVQLVRGENLDKIKALYDSVDTCEIFCLHTKKIKSLYSIYCVDRLDDDEFIQTDPERSWITCPVAQIKRAEMLEKYAQISAESSQKSELVFFYLLVI